jgi:hypothetical protein
MFLINKKFFILFFLVLTFITIVNTENISYGVCDKDILKDSSLNGVTSQMDNNYDPNEYVPMDLSSNSNPKTNSQITTKYSYKSKKITNNLNSAYKKSSAAVNVKKNNVTKVWINHINIKSDTTVITLKSNKIGVIYYTIDGSKPTVKSKKYVRPIKISSKTTLKYFMVGKDGVSSKISTYKRFLGKTAKGYVEKLYYGNLSSDKTIALVVGVHVQESGMHKAIQHSLKTKNSLLNRRFVLYYIHVIKNKDNYDKSRMNGQVLAKKFVVKDISNEKPYIFTDVHETRYKISGYKYPRFIHIMSTNARPGVKVSKKLYKKSVVYLNRLLKLAPHLKRYDPPPTGSSPPYVTIPIANKGFVSYVYETEASYSTKTKQSQAVRYILALDKVNLNFN